MIHKQFTKKWRKSPSGFELTNEDLHNLYDFLEIISGNDFDIIDIKKTLRINKLDSWFDEFHIRIEKKAVPELWEDKK